MEYIKHKLENVSGGKAHLSAIEDKPMSLPSEKFETDSTIKKEEAKTKISTVYKQHPTMKMKAAVWKGKESLDLDEVPAPMITDPSDAIVRITSMTICGSDLHMYFNAVPGPPGTMQKGDIVGHEACGVITEVGPLCNKFKVGQRVSISAGIACGDCIFCKSGKWSLCDNSNPSLEQEKLYGYRTSALFGYTHLTGAYAGLFAEYARVPVADVNLMELPQDSSVSEDVAPMLSDTALTGYWATELAKVQQGESVVVIGCGPIGLMAAYSSVFKGASVVIAVDKHPERLELAKRIGALPINITELPSGRTLEQEITEKYLPLGPDCVLDCTGFRFPKKESVLHDFTTKLGLSTDTVDNIALAIHLCKKGGRVSLIGDYFGSCNAFPIGALMEKGITISGGQIFVHQYREQFKKWIMEKKIDPAFMISHKLPFNDIVKGFDMFAHHKDNAVKICLRTEFGEEMVKKWGNAVSDIEAAKKPPAKGGAWEGAPDAATTQQQPRPGKNLIIREKK